MKRIISVVLLFTLLFSMFAAAHAATTRASELISVTSITATVKSGGVVKFTASMSATGIVDQVGFTSIKIQKYSGGSWSTVKAIYNKFGYDRISYAYTTSYSGTVGTKYRAVVGYKVVDGSSSDTRTRTSSSVTAAS